MAYLVLSVLFIDFFEFDFKNLILGVAYSSAIVLGIVILPFIFLTFILTILHFINSKKDK